MNEKYLPEGFSNNSRLHAYLFISPDAKIRRDTAVKAAKSVLCDNCSENAVPCGKCPNCVKMDAGTHPDCFFIGADGEKTGVDDVRKIENEAYLATNEASRKVFVLENADKYSVQSQNALLKIIEEPPKNVIFILTASSKNSLLPTVRSRVCALYCKARTLEEYTSAVSAAHKLISPELCKKAALFAMNYDDTPVEMLDTDTLLSAFELADKYFSGQERQPVLSFPKKREQMLCYLQTFMLVLRDILVCRTAGSTKDSFFPPEEISRWCAKTSQKRAVSLYDTFEDAYLHLDSFSNLNALLAVLSQNI